MICEACKGAGWILANDARRGLEIQKCDACKVFKCDDTAKKYVLVHELSSGHETVHIGGRGPLITVVNILMSRSCWFQVTPRLYGIWAVTVKVTDELTDFIAGIVANYEQTHTQHRPKLPEGY